MATTTLGINAGAPADSIQVAPGSVPSKRDLIVTVTWDAFASQADLLAAIDKVRDRLVKRFRDLPTA